MDFFQDQSFNDSQSDAVGSSNLSPSDNQTNYIDIPVVKSRVAPRICRVVSLDQPELLPTDMSDSSDSESNKNME